MNKYTKDLNTTLINSHYPHLTNQLFKHLTLPYGLINNTPKINNCKKFTICNSGECISDETYEKLTHLVNKSDHDKKGKPKEKKGKPKEKNGKPTRKGKPTKKDKPTKKKKSN